MKNLNICIDIDGTITEPYYWLKCANEYFGLKISEDQITSYDIAKVLQVETKAYLEFYERNKLKIHSEEKLREDSIEIINLLSKENNIYFVTARDKSLELLTFLYLI